MRLKAAAFQNAYFFDDGVQVSQFFDDMGFTSFGVL